MAQSREWRIRWPKPASPATAAFQQISDAIDSVNKKVEVPAAARDFVKRTAATTKQRAEAVHAHAAKAAEGAEKLATSLVGGYANFTRSLLDISLANVQHTLATVEKLAGARSLNEAVEVQADFVRESARANVERVRNAAEFSQVRRRRRREDRSGRDLQDLRFRPAGRLNFLRNR